MREAVLYLICFSDFYVNLRNVHTFAYRIRNIELREIPLYLSCVSYIDCSVFIDVSLQQCVIVQFDQIGSMLLEICHVADADNSVAIHIAENGLGFVGAYIVDLILLGVCDRITVNRRVNHNIGAVAECANADFRNAVGDRYLVKLATRCKRIVANSGTGIG